MIKVIIIYINDKVTEKNKFFTVQVLLSIDRARFISLSQVVSPFPPSDKIGIKSVQREVEEIVDMKQMKMDWVPYIPYGKRYLFLIFLIGFIIILTNLLLAYIDVDLILAGLKE